MAKKKKEEKIIAPKTVTQQLIYSVKVVVMFIFILFCFFNGVASQIMPNLYFQLVKEDPQAEVAFFKTARLLPEFKALFPEIRQSFTQHEKEIYADERNTRTRIAELEELLKENPQSRDVLYALSLLHEQEGNTGKAAEYLQKAKALDPAVDTIKN